MMAIKNHNRPGLSLIEVLISVAVLGVLATSVYTLLQTSFNNDLLNAARLTRIFQLKNQLYDPELFKPAAQGKQEAAQKQVLATDPPTQITVEHGAPTIAALAKFKFIDQLTASAQWQSVAGVENIALFLLRFVAPKPKDTENT